MDERPWWHLSRDDEWDEPLPAVVTLEPDYGAELPLTSDEGMLGRQQTGFSPQLLNLCVPITSSTSCDQVIFVDQAADPSLSSDAVQVEVDRLG
jgi:hypothetical protein